MKKALGPATLAALAAIVLLASVACLADLEKPHGRGLIPFERQREPYTVRVPTPLAPLPARFDWREEGKVTPVKDQGSCGACYAFGALADFESKILLAGGQTYDFSENNVKECEFYTRRCSGGTYWFVANYLSTGGTVMEECDRYQSSMTGCKTTCPKIKTLLDWRVISEGWQASTEVLKSCIAAYGPVFVGLYAGYNDAWEYEFEAYDGSYTLNYTGGAKYANHAGLIIGWDDSLAYYGGKGAWIIKNSWGTDWGGACGYGDEKGYYTLAYGSAQVGQAASFLYEWQDYDPDGRIFYYDEGGYTKGLGFGSSTTAWGMCMFIPDVDVRLQRVEFWSFDRVLDADVYIYDDFDGSAPSGLITSRLDYYNDYMGYHSVVLPSSPVVAASDTIFVAVKITADADTVPIPVDRYGPRQTGRCFASPDGVSWSAAPGGDIGIRLRATRYADAIPPELSLRVDHPAQASNGIDVYVTASEEIEPASLDVTVGSQHLTMEPDVSPPNTYKGHYGIAIGGVLVVSAEAMDLVGNLGSATTSLKVSQVTAAAGGSVASEDGLMYVTIGERVLGGDAFLAVSPLATEIEGVTDAYRVTPAGVPLADFVEISIGYGEAMADPEHLSVASLGAIDATPLKSFVDLDAGRIVAYAESLGAFGLYRSDDVSNPLIGSGRLRLHQNYPNPFGTGTSIVFELPRSGHLDLSIYTVEGRLVKVLTDGVVARGIHRTDWDGTDSRGERVASGVYYLKAESGVGGGSRKLVVAN